LVAGDVGADPTGSGQITVIAARRLDASLQGSGAIQ